MITIEDTGAIGIVKDLKPHRVPVNAWTDGRNIAFENGHVKKAKGYSVFTDSAVAPYAIFPAPTASNHYWIYAGLAAVYGILGTGAAAITRASGPYTGGEFDLWNSCDFDGIPVLNNGVDVPQVWNTPDLSTKLTALPNWPGATTAKVVKAFRNFLVALDVTKTGTRYPRMIKWSHSAAPGELPASWDETDSTKDAGEFSLPSGLDSLVDALDLGEIFVLYLESSAWGMRLSGTYSIFNFGKLLPTVGALSQSCVAPFRNQHFVLSADDVVVHNGSAVESVIDSKMRDWLFANINPSSYRITRVVPFNRRKEMWVCFPSSGSGLINMAAVWNWAFNTWTIHELPDVRAIASSLFNPEESIQLWDYADTEQWDSGVSSTWVPLDSPSKEVLIFAPRSIGHIFKADECCTRDSGAYESYIEKTGIAAVEMSQSGQPIVDLVSEKFLCSIYPTIEAPNGTQFTITVGYQERLGADVTWKTASDDPPGEGTFIVGTDTKIDLYATGRLLAVRFSTTASVDWALTSFSLDIQRVSIN